MTHPVDPEGRAARFIALEMHESTHDRLVWGMRQNRDKAVAGVPGVGETARTGLADQGAHAHAPGPVPRTVRGQRHQARHARPLGA
jgi:hypothetical protein